jgi:hypothetical protein
MILLGKNVRLTGAEAESEGVCVTLVRGLWKKQKEIWKRD